MRLEDKSAEKFVCEVSQHYVFINQHDVRIAGYLHRHFKDETAMDWVSNWTYAIDKTSDGRLFGHYDTDTRELGQRLEKLTEKEVELLLIAAFPLTL